LHRVVWDLRYQGAKLIKGARLDGGAPKVGPLVLPGTYGLELKAGDKVATARVEVRLDPREIQAVRDRIGEAAVAVADERLAVARGNWKANVSGQIELGLKIRDDITDLTHAVEQIRSVRKQIEARAKLLEGVKKAESLVKASKEFLPKLDDLEAKFHNPKAKVSYDILAQKGGAKLYSQLAWLLEQIKDADGPVTQGIRDVYAKQHKLLDRYKAEWQELVKKDVAALNEQARKLDLPGLFVAP
jgi:hypothetical protein